MLKRWNIIYYSTIMKQELIQTILIGLDVRIRAVFVREETVVPGGNPPFRFV